MNATRFINPEPAPAIKAPSTVAATTAAGAAGAAGVAGSPSSIIYNSVTYSAGGGLGGTLATSVLAGGAGGSAPYGFGTTNGMNLPGNPGHAGGVMAATTNIAGIGGNTPLGWGQGGVMPETAAGQAGQPGTGYGAGGSGARNGTGATARAGGTGAPGIIIIEY